MKLALVLMKLILKNCHQVNHLMSFKVNTNAAAYGQIYHKHSTLIGSPTCFICRVSGHSSRPPCWVFGAVGHLNVSIEHKDSLFYSQTI